jgi:hypothetical protein
MLRLLRRVLPWRGLPWRLRLRHTSRRRWCRHCPRLLLLLQWGCLPTHCSRWVLLLWRGRVVSHHHDLLLLLLRGVGL